VTAPAPRADLPVVICVPSADGAFRAAVLAVLEAQPRLAPEELEAGVRLVYPDAVVRRRDLTAEPVEVWYAYRDGAYAGPRDATWVDEPGTAWARFDPATGEIVADNAAMAALFSPGASTLVGRFAREFIPPGADAISDRQLEAVREADETRSLGRARREDGREIIVEFVARAHDGALEAWYREVSIATRGGA